MAPETIGERHQNEAESDNDPEPDQPHGHLVEDGWRKSSRPENATVESGALSKGEDAFLVEAAVTDSVGDSDVGQGPLAYATSDLVYG